MSITQVFQIELEIDEEVELIFSNGAQGCDDLEVDTYISNIVEIIITRLECEFTCATIECHDAWDVTVGQDCIINQGSTEDRDARVSDGTNRR